MTEPVNTRRYDSSKRRAVAVERRRRIVDTAAQLFLANGYARTTTAEIAQSSDVSNDLIFRLFGSKRGILKEVMDYVIGGDAEDIAVLDRPEPEAVRQCSDQREQLQLFSIGITKQLARVAPYSALVQAAAAVEPEIEGLWADLNLRQRRTSMTTVAEWLADNGPLKDSKTVEDAAAILWTLTSSDVYLMLTNDWHWTTAQYQQWLLQMLLAALVPER
ncbi:TetR/AcrR family transcriptional regulator [Mycobacterium aquaticum]|uniref:HTH tetR-type domain-containing protein n=1 Tax=Mycobacterium aquaticum TaxID=1927124 RepID=A0A1X0B1Z8_9MYCO|nr:TetR/AcrR family transcriptional regulator [Mycobacterium aquaticum]ORA35896.1 hypothetical protein BST13_12825 [Mycobacterium aquaticum]